MGAYKGKVHKRGGGEKNVFVTVRGLIKATTDHIHY